MPVPTRLVIFWVNPLNNSLFRSLFIAAIRTIWNAITYPRCIDPHIIGTVALKGLFPHRHMTARRRLGFVGPIPHTITVLIVLKPNTTTTWTGHLLFMMVYAPHQGIVIASIVGQYLIDVFEFVLDLVVVVDLDPRKG